MPISITRGAFIADGVLPDKLMSGFREFVEEQKGIRALICDGLERYICEPVHDPREYHNRLSSIVTRLATLGTDVGIPILLSAYIRRAARDRVPTLADVDGGSRITGISRGVVLLHPDSIGMMDEVEIRFHCGKPRRLLLSKARLNRELCRFEEA
ncbi:MAG: hypothetical protein AAB229_08605 [Candidatus Hydrogenedentota bacterium]